LYGTNPLRLKEAELAHLASRGTGTAPAAAGAAPLSPAFSCPGPWASAAYEFCAADAAGNGTALEAVFEPVSDPCLCVRF